MKDIFIIYLSKSKRMSIKFVDKTRNIVVDDDGSLCSKVYGPAEKKEG